MGAKTKISDYQKTLWEGNPSCLRKTFYSFGSDEFPWVRRVRDRDAHAGKIVRARAYTHSLLLFSSLTPSVLLVHELVKWGKGMKDFGL